MSYSYRERGINRCISIGCGTRRDLDNSIMIEHQLTASAPQSMTSQGKLKDYDTSESHSPGAPRPTRLCRMASVGCLPSYHSRAPYGCSRVVKQVIHPADFVLSRNELVGSAGYSSKGENGRQVCRVSVRVPVYRTYLD
jgi:hypothetical protein